VAFRKTWGMYIRRRRVSLAEIYCLIVENFHIAYTDGTGESGIGVASVCGDVQVGGVAVLSTLIPRRVGWVSN
jgi:hypothetical protein